MQLIINILCAACSFSCGWFTCRALQEAIDGIHSWREQARWAVAAAILAFILFFIHP